MTHELAGTDPSQLPAFHLVGRERHGVLTTPRGPREQQSVDRTYLQSLAYELPIAGDLSARIRQLSEVVAFSEPKADELSDALDAIVGEDRATFSELEEALRDAFPGVRRIILRKAARSEPKKLLFEVSGGAEVPAEDISAGVRAFTNLLCKVYRPNVAPTELLLIEEPENGIHPRRLVKVAATSEPTTARTEARECRSLAIVLDRDRDPQRLTEWTIPSPSSCIVFVEPSFKRFADELRERAT